MGVVSDFLGSVFGVGYIGYKIHQEHEEIEENKRQTELVHKFVDKYCDLEMEAQFTRIVEDPSQTENVWETIVSFVRNNDPHKLFLPIDILEANFFRDRNEYPAVYGWHEIKRGDRVPFFDRGRINARNINFSLMLKDNRNTAVRYLLMTKGKMPKRVARANASRLLNEIGNEEFVIKYLSNK